MRWMKKRKKVAVVYSYIIFWSILWVHHTDYFIWDAIFHLCYNINFKNDSLFGSHEDACYINKNDGKHNETYVILEKSKEEASGI